LKRAYQRALHLLFFAKLRRTRSAHRQMRIDLFALLRLHFIASVKTPAEERSPRSAATRSRSSQPAQLSAQFARSPKQRILHRLFSRPQRFAYRPQLNP